MNSQDELLPQLNRLQARSLITGGAGVVLLVVGTLVSPRQVLQSYLYGYLFWIGLTLGCLGILLLHHLVSGAWGHLIQRITESGARTLPLMFLLFIPILIGMKDLYPWTNHELVEANHAVQKKIAYLNIPFFVVRAVIYFLFWTGVTFALTGWSRAQDKTADASITRRMKMFSGPALAIFVVTVTLASVDWMMSLEPEWYSTIYGMLMIVGAVLTTLAFAIIGIRLLSGQKVISEILTTRHIHHLGNLLMAFTILWAYMAFSQFLIIWAGNLPEDNMWHLKRLGTGWNIIALFLLIGHFFVPFFLLLSRRRKRLIKNLSYVAMGILVMRFVDLFWVIVPAFSGNTVRLHWLDLVAPIAIGGIWMMSFVRDFKGQPLLPLHDPRFVNGQSVFQH
ncbi:MAG TPA: hypothetical protein VGR15_03115 [Bacteroidota bacterium]|jgi:hypothetical protein|nr:hypothetical protein [Bacteroidota bacterium]